MARGPAACRRIDRLAGLVLEAAIPSRLRRTRVARHELPDTARLALRGESCSGSRRRRSAGAGNSASGGAERQKPHPKRHPRRSCSGRRQSVHGSARLQGQTAAPPAKERAGAQLVQRKDAQENRWYQTRHGAPLDSRAPDQLAPGQPARSGNLRRRSLPASVPHRRRSRAQLGARPRHDHEQRTRRGQRHGESIRIGTAVVRGGFAS